MKRILIGSPVRQTPEILIFFLQSLAGLSRRNIELDCYFIDDNDIEEAKSMLRIYKGKHDGNVLIQSGEQTISPYVRDERTHFWDEHLIWKVADYKNQIIEYCVEHDYDYLFLVDSDLILHPKTLEQLMDANRDIISEIFWTKWQPNAEELPQIWLYDQYNVIPKARSEVLSKEESDQRVGDFLNIIRKPGVYEVGGLGACTLISKKALERGVSFREIYNVSFWGEDRHFCIRAAALGFQLYVDTHCPAYHIYRRSDLDGAKAYVQNCTLSSVEISSFTENTDLDVNFCESLVKDLVNSLYRFDYRISTGYEGLQHLPSQCVQPLLEVREQNLNWLVDNCITSLPLLGQPQIEDQTSVNMRINVPFTLEIYRNKQKEKLPLESRFTLRKAERSKWLIENISVWYADGTETLSVSLVDLIQCKKRRNKDKDNKVTLMMLVRNEADKLLKQTLSHAEQYVDAAVILDDASTDNTVEICKEVFKGKPLTIISNKKHGFCNEIELRKQLWNLTVQTDPDWILALDADEIFEDNIRQYIQQLIDQPAYDYYTFRLYDMWDADHYREETYWKAHLFYRIFLTRYQADFKYSWLETPQHCGRLPHNISFLNGCHCNIRLKHYGWSTPGLRNEKYKRYLTLDPDGKYGSMNQYKTILSPNPILKKWE